MASDRELSWLRKVRDLSHLMVVEADTGKLLPMILDAAIELTEAERGFLVLVRDRAPGAPLKIKVEVARGFDRMSLRGPQGDVSRTVVQRVANEVRGLVTSEDLDRDILQVSSVRERRVLSIMCVPMRLRGECVGVFYLDHRFTQDAFSAGDLPFLQTFADQAALALEHAKSVETQSAQQDAPVEVVEDSPTFYGPVRDRFGRLHGGSQPMQRLYQQIELVAGSWDPVLILSEPGCGQEAVAREIHERSGRQAEPFVSAMCRGMTGSALQGLLAGHDEQDPRGLFARAGSGTLFLDGLEAAPLRLQEALLRYLLSRADEGFGPGSCRLIACGAPDLRERVGAGELRADLYYRLDVLRVSVPPLRVRPEDVLPLFEFFARRARGRMPRLSPKAKELLMGYAWPGNVAELRVEAERVVGLGLQRISARQLCAEVREGRGVSRASESFAGKTLPQVEEQMIVQALESCGGNKAQAARQLGIARTTLYHLLERYGLT